jgi:cytoskeletal protein RodZ
MGAGERLKERREALGRSIEDVSVELRISGKYLRGIEEGNYDGFPARVFSLGFIKSYAAFLGEEPEPLIREYNAMDGDSAAADSSVTVAVSSHWVRSERKRGNRMALYLGAAAVVLAIGSVLSWYTSRPVEVPRLPAPPPAAPAPQAVVPPGVAAADNTAREKAPAADNAAVAEIAPAPASASPDNLAIHAEAANATPPYQLYMQATEQTWLMYSTDDGEPVDTMLYPGDKLSVHAGRKIFLKLGNAGGVAATLNGRRIPAFGGRGQVRVVTLGK